MKRPILVVTAIFICIFSSSCSKRVSGTVAGAEVTALSVKRMPEFKVAGGGTGYGAPTPLRAGNGNELAVIDLKSNKEIKLGDQGVKATVKDDKGQAYESVFSQTFGFEDKHTEITIVFEVPAQIALKTLMLDTTSLDLSGLKN